MGNILDELIGGDTSECDGLWTMLQEQSKEIKELKAKLAKYEDKEHSDHE